MSWIRIEDHLINLNNVAGFSVHNGTEIRVHYPSSTYTVFVGTENQCQLIFDALSQGAGTFEKSDIE
jgi:hypothetical protein